METYFDRGQVYLTHLQSAKKAHRCTILSYCLMTNHVHLQIETEDIEISQMMKQVNMMYAIFFNDKYNFVGQLMQGRYRAELIETDEYNLETSRYIHLNPVHADIVETPSEYDWSSYQDFLGLRESELVSTDKILAYFRGKDPLLYQHYVEYYLKREGESWQP